MKHASIDFIHANNRILAVIHICSFDIKMLDEF